MLEFIINFLLKLLEVLTVLQGKDVRVHCLPALEENWREKSKEEDLPRASCRFVSCALASVEKDS